jgi:hypothetical protein
MLNVARAARCGEAWPEGFETFGLDVAAGNKDGEDDPEDPDAEAVVASGGSGAIPVAEAVSHWTALASSARSSQSAAAGMAVAEEAGENVGRESSGLGVRVGASVKSKP